MHTVRYEMARQRITWYHRTSRTPQITKLAGTDNRLSELVKATVLYNTSNYPNNSRFQIIVISSFVSSMRREIYLDNCLTQRQTASSHVQTAYSGSSGPTNLTGAMATRSQTPQLRLSMKARSLIRSSPGAPAADALAAAWAVARAVVAVRKRPGGCSYQR